MYELVIKMNHDKGDKPRTNKKIRQDLCIGNNSISNNFIYYSLPIQQVITLFNMYVYSFLGVEYHCIMGITIHNFSIFGLSF